VRIESEALLSFRLESPITVTPVGTIQRGQNNFTGRHSAPPQGNYNDVIDYSDDNSSRGSSDRPVLKRRPQGSNDLSDNQSE
jgi:hypothetical protein